MIRPLPGAEMFNDIRRDDLDGLRRRAVSYERLLADGAAAASNAESGHQPKRTETFGEKARQKTAASATKRFGSFYDVTHKRRERYSWGIGAFFSPVCNWKST